MERPWRSAAAYWLVPMALLSLLFFFFLVSFLKPIVQGYLHSQLTGPFPSITSQEYTLQTCLPTAWFYGGIFSVEVPSSQMTLACLKLTQI